VVSIVLVGVAGALFLGGETEAASLRANSLGRLDTSTGDVREQIAVGAGPTDVVAGDGDSLWVVSRQARSLWQVERSSGAVVDKIPVGAAPVAAAFGDGAVWVVDGVSRRLYRVDAATGSVVKEHEVGNGASAVAFAAGHAWVTNTLDGTLTVVDATSSDSRTVPVGLEPVALAADGRGVWVANRGSDNVVFLDATLLEPEAVAVGRQPSAVAVGGGAVWVANAADATVSKVDRARRSVVDTVPVGREPRSVAYAGDAAWVASEETGTVTRIAGDGDAEPTRVGGGPTALEAVNGELWVTALAARATHRGGTLRITGRFPVTDPYFMSPGANINPIVNDGLVAYRATGGPAGTELVPDLAQELPRPSADGRRYTFRLRRGIRYSSGDEVEASHVRESFERMFAVRADGSHFFVESIQGADRCIEQPAACDLSRAIVADDREATVTFRLARPDPLFLYKLALPPAWVLPPGTPRRPFSLTPLPATGPYMIDRVDRGRRMVLVRNPHFREWSRAAQPSGFPDRIVITTPDRDPQQLVATNRADVMEGVITPSAARSLAVRYPARVIAAPTNEVFTAVLNTNRPPFNDRRVRQALNYAVDRGKATAALGGPLFGRPTCQLIPPNVLGHRPFCPYTRRPSAGVWSAPDLARAKRLVAASGTRGSRVVVWTSRWPPLSGFGDVLVGALRSLGYRATVREIGGKDVYVYYNAFGPSRAAQIGPMRWGLDFPVPQDAFFPLIACDGLNRARHCDPRLDAAFATASDLMVREPAAAPAAWAQIDRDVAERGLHVPLVNGTSVDFISDRVGNFQQHPVWGPLYSQMWVR
jgi:peptide/nickel transport system substrate-binding protein